MLRDAPTQPEHLMVDLINLGALSPCLWPRSRVQWRNHVKDATGVEGTSSGNELVPLYETTDPPKEHYRASSDEISVMSTV